jgi:ABC-type amino acid transport substrate-binding protein
VGERGYCLVLRADDRRFREIGDLLKANVVLATVQGTDGEYYFLTNRPRVRLRSVSIEEAEGGVKEVLAGTADATQLDASVARLFVQRYPQLKMFPNNCVEQPLWPVPWGISIRSDDPDLLRFLQAFVAKAKETGWLRERTERWLEAPRIKDALDLG